MTPDAAGIEAALAAGLIEALLRQQFGGSYDDIMAGPSGPAWREGDVSRQAARLAAALLPVVTQAQAEAWDEGYRARSLPNRWNGPRNGFGDPLNPHRARADESGA